MRIRLDALAHFQAWLHLRFASLRYRHPGVLSDFRLARAVLERRMPVLVLLAGTSGTGKSTLASLIASRLGIQAVISTDSVRQVLRTVSADPLLHESTYSACNALPHDTDPESESAEAAGADTDAEAQQQRERKRVVQGYKRQSELVVNSLEEILSACEKRWELLLEPSCPHPHPLS